MPFQVSPGVNVSEIDLTGSVPAVSLTTGAIAGVFRWGPIDKISTVTSEASLAARYGRPTNLNGETWLSASSFLAYAGGLLVSRAANTTDSAAGTLSASAIANTGATVNAVTQTVKNVDHYQSHAAFDLSSVYVAKYPGALGNSLKVSVCESAAAFSANINLIPNANTSPTSNVSIAVGSNTALVAIGFAGPGTIATANATAIATKAQLTVGDIVRFGNSSIGYQNMKVSAIGGVTANTTISSFAVSFQDTLKLISNVSASNIQRYWEYYTVIDVAPGQSPYVGASGNTAANDEVHVVVSDATGLFSGSPGSILETYKGLSRATDAKGPEGNSIFYKQVINDTSRYLWWANDLTPSNTAVNVTSSTQAAPLSVQLTGGQDGRDEYAITAADLARAYDLYRDDDNVQFGLVLTGPGNQTIQNYIIDNITSVRKDSIAFVSAPKAAVVGNPGGEVDAINNWASGLRSSKYSFRDSGYKYMYDKYNDVYRWVPLNGDMAGLAARTDANNDAWWSPAGFNRGVVKNVVKLAFNLSKKIDRDAVYRNGVNPVVTFNPEGTVLFGDRTGLMTNSAFTSLPVTRLFITLEKAIATAAKYSMFEFNDSFTQSQFRNMVNPYLRDIQGRRGIKKFDVICDDSNNTEEVVNSEQFVADIYIQPNRSANKIQLNFIAVDKSVTFTEKAGGTGS